MLRMCSLVLDVAKYGKVVSKLVFASTYGANQSFGRILTRGAIVSGGKLWGAAGA